MTLLDRGVAAFNEYFTTELATIPEDTRIRAANRGKETGKWWLQEAPKMVDNYIQWRKNNPTLMPWVTPDGEVAIEIGIDIKITEHTTVKGFIDRVFEDTETGELIIIDFKSGKTIPNTIQLAWYRLLLNDRYGVSPKYGAYWMARNGTLDSIHDLDRFPVETVRVWADDVYQNIQKKIFAPSVSYDCKDCGLATMCYTQNKNLPVPALSF